VVPRRVDRLARAGRDPARQFFAEIPRLPLAYFEEVAPDAAGWDSIRCGYLRLSDAYEDTAAEAVARGWPLKHYPSDHLAMVTQPEAIAAALDQMLERMGFPPLPR